MFRNLKVSKKITLSFGIVIVLYIVAVIAGTIGLFSVANGLESFYNHAYPIVRESLQISNLTTSIQRDIWNAYVVTDNAQIQSLLAGVESNSTQIAAYAKELEAQYDGDPQLLSNFKSALEATKAPREKTIQYVRAQDDKNALALLTGEYTAACNNLNASLNSIISYAEENAGEYYTSGMAVRVICIAILLGMAVVSLIMTVLINIKLAKDITRPLAEIKSAAEDWTKGAMKSSVTYQSKDELGEVADSMRFVSKTLSEYIDDVTSLLLKMAQGDLTVSADMEYLGDWASIRTSVNQILDSLNDTLGQINRSSEQVSSGSEQVSSSAQALSQGATEQASAVEELAATINEISHQVMQTADNAHDVGEMVTSTGANVNICNEKMTQMVAAMSKINDSSAQISKIIKTIEDIAFQTHILALNAAVEAARAGAAGKGFAVVADEVRNLAAKSAEAAKNTTTLISGSLSAVEEGSQLVDSTQQSLLEVVDSASKIVVAVQKISDATNDQSNAVQQVTQGIDQISAVVQTNSATAEESAAASEELSSQAQMLKSLVAQFQIKGIPSTGTPQLSYSHIPDEAGANDFFGDNKY